MSGLEGSCRVGRILTQPFFSFRTPFPSVAIREVFGFVPRAGTWNSTITTILECGRANRAYEKIGFDGLLSEGSYSRWSFWYIFDPILKDELDATFRKRVVHLVSELLRVRSTGGLTETMHNGDGLIL